MTHLEFVGPEEASKWPEGTRVLAAKFTPDGAEYAAVNYWEGGDPRSYLGGWSRFARLPDTLPEIER